MVNTVEITNDGKYIVSKNKCTDIDAGKIKIWNINTNKEIKKLEGHSNFINKTIITSDEKNIISASTDETIKIWDINSGNEIKCFEVNSNGFLSVVISHDNSFIVSGNSNHTIKIWDINSGKTIRTFNGHKSYITSIAITPDDKYIISGSEDNTIKIWDINSGEELAEFISFNDKEWISHTKDGYYNCSYKADKYFSFLDENEDMPKVLEESHPIYKQKKVDNLQLLNLNINNKIDSIWV